MTFIKSAVAALHREILLAVYQYDDLPRPLHVRECAAAMDEVSDH